MGIGSPFPSAIRVSATGVTIAQTSTTASAPTNVPTDVNGNPAKIVRVSVDHNVRIKFGPSKATATCASTDPLLTPNGGPEYFNVLGQGFWSVALDTSSATTAVVSIVPVEL